jgi:hypothetical protein
MPVSLQRVLLSSKFIEEAAKWRIFDQTLSEVRSKLADVPADELEATINKAIVGERQLP